MSKDLVIFLMIVGVAYCYVLVRTAAAAWFGAKRRHIEDVLKTADPNAKEAKNGQPSKRS